MERGRVEPVINFLYTTFMKVLHTVAFLLVSIGGLTWGLIGLSALTQGGNWNIVNLIAGYIGGAQVENIIYVLVGLSAVWLFVGHKKDCRNCSM